MRKKKGFTPPFWRKTSNASTFTKRAGFTLIELVVVIAIVAITSAIMIPLMGRHARAARALEARAALNAIRASLEEEYANYGEYDHNFPPTTVYPCPVAGNVPGISEDDLNGRFFQAACYAVTEIDTDTFVVQVTGKIGTPAEGIVLTITETGEIREWPWEGP